MAKTSSIQRNKHRRKLVKQHAKKRASLKATIMNQALSMEELFRGSSAVRIHNRCELSGRPRAVYRKFKLSRIALRDLASQGQIPGMVKASW